MEDPSPVLTLQVTKGPCKGETLHHRAGAALRVGRVAKGNHLAVRDAGASQSHLSVQFLPPPAARWAVTDLGSSNGTVLNDATLVPTVPTPLSHGDIIKIGESTVLAVSISAAAAEEQPPAVTRRAGRKAAAVEAPEAGKEVKEEPAVATRRGCRRKAADPPDEEKEAAVPSRRGGRKKAAEPPDAEKEEKEEAADPPDEEKEAAVPTRRGGRKKAAEPPDADKEEKEEAAVPTRRGGRKKAAEPPQVVEIEEEEEEAAVPRRGEPRNAAVAAALPPPPQSTRSTRAAARRGEAAGCGNDEGKVATTRNGRGRVTRARARKGTDAAAQEEDEGVVAEARDREGNPQVTAAKGGEEEDMVETGGGTSNAPDVPAAVRGRTKRGRGGRGRAPRASSRKAHDAIVEEDEKEQEEKDMTDGRESRGSPLRVIAVNAGEEDMVETGGGTSNAPDVPAAVRGRTMRSRGGRGKATRASSRKAQDAILEEDEKEQEENDMTDGRESRGSPLRVIAVNAGEEKVATGDGKVDGTPKASMEDDKMVGVEEEDVSLAMEGGRIGRASEGRVSALHVPSGNGGMEGEEGKDSIRGEENEGDQESKRERMVPKSKLDGVGEEEDNGNREAIGSDGEEGCVKESIERRSLKDMTLEKWFAQVEKYLLAKNEEAAEKAIAEVQDKHRRFCEHLKTLK